MASAAAYPQRSVGVGEAIPCGGGDCFAAFGVSQRQAFRLSRIPTNFTYRMDDQTYHLCKVGSASPQFICFLGDFVI